jgi:hypothetical protein
MTLSCVNSNVQSVSKIAEICRLKKDDVRTSLAVLAESKYIVTSGVLSFLSRKITADGIRILSIYSKVFGKDEDVVDMMKRLEVETEEDNDGA